MESLYILIPISIVLVFIIGVLFWWSLRNGQYDDMEGPAYRMLMDDRDEGRPAPDEASTPQAGRGADPQRRD
ncbi:Cytochrome oxidase maturation protein, cbb3-type [Thauera humireducens]|jgi:cbb3-type cytochrome oxidase maturation protein|uniref:cbb3-type cytochrome oxidase assembly protein CcoS n=1 Tax=Thauera TaxID=33057 RepID=UPI0002CFC401|nr:MULTISPECIES: cbb3-type cytochrome oxidase assembly protein CcoS [Thauera]ENO77823.1 cytochrome oxidase maturation protein, cbb3-type [Thauera sp. 63]CAH1745443.1 Cytochrome oxidase maturation protein, cbb3-type [Thauera humireducens]